MKVGIQGIEGSFSEEAAKSYCKKFGIEDFELKYLVSSMNVLDSLSNIHKRENFRKTSVIKNVCIGQFFGEGKQSYINGIKHILEIKK